MMDNKIELENMDFEISFYKGIILRSPNFIEALSALGDLYTKKGRYEEGLQIDKRLLSLRGNDPIILYNLACSYSLLNNISKAFIMFKKAIYCGYCDFAHLDKDKDLDNLKMDTRFKKYLSKIKNTPPSSSVSSNGNVE